MPTILFPIKIIKSFVFYCFIRRVTKISAGFYYCRLILPTSIFSDLLYVRLNAEDFMLFSSSGEFLYIRELWFVNWSDHVHKIVKPAVREFVRISWKCSFWSSVNQWDGTQVHKFKEVRSCNFQPYKFFLTFSADHFQYSDMKFKKNLGVTDLLRPLHWHA